MPATSTASPSSGSRVGERVNPHCGRGGNIEQGGNVNDTFTQWPADPFSVSEPIGCPATNEISTRRHINGAAWVL